MELVHPMDGYILQPPALGREKMELPVSFLNNSHLIDVELHIKYCIYIHHFQ